jgi:hypothetical protein
MQTRAPPHQRLRGQLRVRARSVLGRRARLLQQQGPGRMQGQQQQVRRARLVSTWGARLMHWRDLQGQQPQPETAL